MCWNSWQENLKQTLKGGEIFGSEQLAMNMSVYVDNVETEFLPLNCNWITSNLLPKFDEDKDTCIFILIKFWQKITSDPITV